MLQGAYFAPQDTTPTVIEQLREAAGQAIQIIAQAVGHTTEYVWPILVRQQQVEAVTAILAWTGVLVLGLIAFVYGFRLVQQSWAKFAESGRHYGWPQDPMGTVSLIVWIVGMMLILAGGIGFFVDGTQQARKLANPEYYAIAKVMDTTANILHGGD